MGDYKGLINNNYIELVWTPIGQGSIFYTYSFILTEDKTVLLNSIEKFTRKGSISKNWAKETIYSRTRQMQLSEKDALVPNDITRRAVAYFDSIQTTTVDIFRDISSPIS